MTGCQQTSETVQARGQWGDKVLGVAVGTHLCLPRIPHPAKIASTYEVELKTQRIHCRQTGLKKRLRFSVRGT